MLAVSLVSISFLGVLPQDAAIFLREAKTADEPLLIAHDQMLPHWPTMQTSEDRAASPQLAASLGSMIACRDKLVNRLLDAVDELGIRDNTHVVFMADNGTNEPDFNNPKVNQAGEPPHTRHTTARNVNGGKFSVTDGGTHVPMIVWGPDAKAARSRLQEIMDARQASAILRK